MTPPLASVVRVASTPEQAKIMVALLQAEGIPARVDGDSLTDEFAMSRRLMNLTGVRVMVPTNSLEQAREILGPVEIDPADLEQQAIAAEAPESVAASTFARPNGPSRRSLWPLLVATGLAVVFLVLWIFEVDKRLSATDPLFDLVPASWGMSQVRRSDGSTASRFYDENFDRVWERTDLVGREGTVVASSFDEDRDGIYERCFVFRDGLTEAWTDGDGDGTYDSCTVADAQGKAVQRLVWRAGLGFVIETP